MGHHHVDDHGNGPYNAASTAIDAGSDRQLSQPMEPLAREVSLPSAASPPQPTATDEDGVGSVKPAAPDGSQKDGGIGVGAVVEHSQESPVVGGEVMDEAAGKGGEASAKAARARRRGGRGRKGSSGEFEETPPDASTPVEEPSPQADEDFHEVVRKGRAKAKPKAAGKKSPTGTGAGSGEMVDSLSKGTTPVGATNNREASSHLKSILGVGNDGTGQPPASMIPQYPLRPSNTPKGADATQRKVYVEHRRQNDSSGGSGSGGYAALPVSTGAGSMHGILEEQERERQRRVREEEDRREVLRLQREEREQLQRMQGPNSYASTVGGNVYGMYRPQGFSAVEDTDFPTLGSAAGDDKFTPSKQQQQQQKKKGKQKFTKVDNKDFFGGTNVAASGATNANPSSAQDTNAANDASGVWDRRPMMGGKGPSIDTHDEIDTARGDSHNPKANDDGGEGFWDTADAQHDSSMWDNEPPTTGRAPHSRHPQHNGASKGVWDDP